MVNTIDDTSFHYVDRKSTMTGDVELIQKYKFLEYPPEIDKKVVLLKHFRTFLSVKQTVKCRLGSDGDDQLEVTPVYIKKLLNSSHGLIMRLSN